MDAELIFSICGNLVLPAWLLLVFLPKWGWTEKLVHYLWIPSIIAIFYAYSFYVAWPFPEGGGFGSLKEVMVAFQHPYLALAGWFITYRLIYLLGLGKCAMRNAEGLTIYW